LNNSLYIGWLEWNRTAYVKNPRTGRKVARINKQEARESVEIPELRIVDDTLWEKVKGRQQEARIEMSKDESSNSLNQVHRRKFLLSELLVCGQCSGRYTVVGKDRYGCATRRAKGTCSNEEDYHPATDRVARPGRAQGQADGARAGRRVHPDVPGGVQCRGEDCRRSWR
jgi:hypothetical protein